MDEFKPPSDELIMRANQINFRRVPCCAISRATPKYKHQAIVIAP